MNNISIDEKLLNLKYNQAYKRVKCDFCQAIILTDDNFCYNCGKPINKIDKESKNFNILNFTDYDSIVNKVDVDTKFIYACVTLLKEIKENPLLINVNNNLLSSFTNVNHCDVLNYLIDNGYVSVANKTEKMDYYFDYYSNNYLLSIMEENSLTPNKTKKKNIKSITDNLSEEKIESYFTHDLFKTTDKADELISNYPQVYIYDKIFNEFNIEHYNDFYMKNKDLTDVGIKFLDEYRENYINSLKWKSYIDLLYNYATLYDLNDDYENMIGYIMEYFISIINPFRDNRFLKSERSFITDELREIMTYSISRANLDGQSLNNLINDISNNLSIPFNCVKQEDIFSLMVDVLDEDIKTEDVNKHLINTYYKKYPKLSTYEFNSIQEQEKIVDELKAMIK